MHADKVIPIDEGATDLGAVTTDVERSTPDVPNPELDKFLEVVRSVFTREELDADDRPRTPEMIAKLWACLVGTCYLAALFPVDLREVSAAGSKWTHSDVLSKLILKVCVLEACLEMHKPGEVALVSLRDFLYCHPSKFCNAYARAVQRFQLPNVRLIIMPVFYIVA
jgi:hypothetical protein